MTEQTPQPLPSQIRDEIVAKHAAPSRPWWREPVFWVICAVVAAAVTGVVIWVSSTVGDAKGAARANAAGLAQANARLRSLGAAPVSTPAPVPVPTVTKTVTTPSPVPVVTDAQLDAAAQRYFTEHPPPRGKAAVVDYSALRQFIVEQVAHITPSPGPAGQSGESGASGEPGQNGQSGQPGQPGQDETQAMADQAMADYCSTHNDCQGPAGTNGTNGTDGHDGQDGKPGQPPFSWTQPGVLPGTTVTCSRTDPFDPDAPTYTCH